MLPILAGLALLQTPVRQINVPPPSPRFELEKPLTTLSGIMADEEDDGTGLAQQMARAHHLQGRVMWVDGTANLERVNTEDKIKQLMAKLAEVGFNTVVFDIKPISGQVLYKSSIAPKITEWRGQTLPKNFDPLPIMVREAHANKLQILVSMNAFSEGHSLFKVGPGYKTPDQQSVLYVATPVVKAEEFNPSPRAQGEGLSGKEADLAPTLNTPPTDGNIHIFNQTPKLRPNPNTVFAAALGNGYVVESASSKVPQIPKGGYLLAANGAGADFLTRHAKFGDVLKIDSKATFLRTSQYTDQYPLMMNPNDPLVQDRNLSIIHEVVENYNVDGVLYDDRLRFAGLDADFSETSRRRFQGYIKRKINWPDDVFKITYSNTLSKGLKPGPFYEDWMIWRALEIRNYIARVHNEIKSTRPGALFGIYGGSWYGEYPNFGSNYGAENLQAGFWFLTRKYNKTGFAGMLDLLITGCYYQIPTIYDAMSKGVSSGSTIEAAGQLSDRVADDQCWTYAGIALDSFAGNPQGLQDALQAACVSTQGVMVFDLSHNIEPMWPVFAEAFQVKAVAPQSQPKELANIRRLRNNYRKMHVQEPPVIIQSGSSGNGVLSL